MKTKKEKTAIVKIDKAISLLEENIRDKKTKIERLVIDHQAVDGEISDVNWIGGVCMGLSIALDTLRTIKGKNL